MVEYKFYVKKLGIIYETPLVEKRSFIIHTFQLLENVLDKRLSSSLSTLYGPHMTCHLSVVQAHLFVCVAQAVSVLPNIEDVM